MYPRSTVLVRSIIRHCILSANVKRAFICVPEPSKAAGKGSKKERGSKTASKKPGKKGKSTSPPKWITQMSREQAEAVVGKAAVEGIL